jgi:hypothetical protein
VREVKEFVVQSFPFNANGVVQHLPPALAGPGLNALAFYPGKRDPGGINPERVVDWRVEISLAQPLQGCSYRRDVPRVSPLARSNPGL